MKLYKIVDEYNVLITSKYEFYVSKTNNSVMIKYNNFLYSISHNNVVKNISFFVSILMNNCKKSEKEINLIGDKILESILFE